MSKRSRRKSSMRADYSGGTWLSGWGNDRKLSQRLARARRKRDARAAANRAAGEAQGGP